MENNFSIELLLNYLNFPYMQKENTGRGFTYRLRVKSQPCFLWYIIRFPRLIKGMGFNRVQSTRFRWKLSFHRNSQFYILAWFAKFSFPQSFSQWVTDKNKLPTHVSTNNLDNQPKNVDVIILHITKYWKYFEILAHDTTKKKLNKTYETAFYKIPQFVPVEIATSQLFHSNWWSS